MERPEYRRQACQVGRTVIPDAVVQRRRTETQLCGPGCGSACAAGAFIDLQTGDVYPPPRQVEASGRERWILAGGFVDGSYIEIRPDSRLVIIRTQSKYAASQEVAYYEWSGAKFRLLATKSEKKRH